MSIIFVSHSSKDHEIAQEIKSRLERQHHLSVFLDFDPDKGIIAGQSWERTLYRKLRASRAVVAICTDNYLTSHWCFAEIALARMEGKTIFALKANPLDDRAEMPSILAESQYIDLRSNKEEGYRRLWNGFEEAKIEPELICRTWNPNDAPYPGLLAFQERETHIYFGRESEIYKSLDLLNSRRRQNLILVLGASGSGKSSLLRAGIVPRLRHGPSRWLVVGPFRPGREPMEELAAALADSFQSDWRVVHQELVENDDWARLARRYLRDARQRDVTLLLVIDQFEELLSHEADHTSAQFLRRLRAGIEAEGSPLMAIATMRSDFLAQFQENPALQAVEFDNILLGPVPVESLRTIIQEPARLGQTELEPGLVDRLLQDTGTSDALPLLAFTLRALWDKCRANGLLTIREYEALGGLQGAIAKEAEAVMAKTLKVWPENKLRSAFLKMVRVNEDGGYARRLARWDELPEGSGDMLKYFVDSRLLLSLGDGTVGVTHEALFRNWTRLAGWLDDSRADLLLQQQIRRAAVLWEEGGRAQDDLWRGGRLQRATDLVNSERLQFEDQDRSFVIESVRVESLNRERQVRLSRYHLLRDAALRQYVTPHLRDRERKLQEEISERDQNRKFHFDDLAENLKQELNVLRNFLGEGGRWHPQDAVHFKSLGAMEDYTDVWLFPCCNKYVLGDGPSQFRADGCEDAPIG
jgi:Novel STAND NTPase 1/TIR domain